MCCLHIRICIPYIYIHMYELLYMYLVYVCVQKFIFMHTFKYLLRMNPTPQRLAGFKMKALFVGAAPKSCALFDARLACHGNYSIFGEVDQA